IEVMGLAILPPRLKTELEEVEKYLLEEENKMASYHKKWADSIKMNHQLTKENVNEVIQKELGQVFKRVLEDAGVFKRDEQGQAGFKRFIDTCLTN
ncbi:UDP-glucose--hexose-1-phosphate uridylyltransferase, partial [Tetragenococcus halophilus]